MASIYYKFIEIEEVEEGKVTVNNNKSTCPQKYVILAPLSDQGLAISRILSSAGLKATGGFLPNERPFPLPESYEGYVCLQEKDLIDPRDSVILPTTGLSTKTFFAVQDSCVTGEVTMRKESLIVGDKEVMLSIAEKAGVPIPGTYPTVAEIVRFPVFYKKKHEAGKGTRGVAYNLADLKALECEHLIFQDVISGDATYGVPFLAKDGELIEFHEYKEVFSAPRTGGSAVIIENFQDKRLVEYTRQLVGALRYSGWGLAEYKMDARVNDYCFMEVNAKFWASCAFSFAQGKFIEKLFGIDPVQINSEELKGMVFLDRYLRSSMRDVVAHLNVLRSYKKVWYSNPLRSFVRGRLRFLLGD